MPAYDQQHCQRDLGPWDNSNIEVEKSGFRYIGQSHSHELKDSQADKKKVYVHLLKIVS